MDIWGEADRQGLLRGLRVRATTAADGAALWDVVRATRLLEPLTGYGYVLLGDQFGETSALAELDGSPAGCVLGLRLPREPRALFVWQIGVHPRAQRRGVAHAMLDAILARPPNADIHTLLATVAPSNDASTAMFQAYAAQRTAQLEHRSGYAADLFPEPHEAERLLRISGLVPPPQTPTRS
jgi:diaminobutyrate acetyltransferase